MATYDELRKAAEEPSLLIKVKVACIVAANKVAVEPVGADPNLHTQRLKWASAAFTNPDSTATKMINSVLAKNATATYAQIIGASDAVVQQNVDDSVNVFALTME